MKRWMCLLMTVVMLFTMVPAGAVSLEDEAEHLEHTSLEETAPVEQPALPETEPEEQPAPPEREPHEAELERALAESGEPMALAAGDTAIISGVLRIPKALKYDLSCYVWAYDETTGESYQTREGDRWRLTFPAGKTSLRYRLEVPADAFITELEARIDDPLTSDYRLISEMYYSSSGDADFWGGDCELDMSDGDVQADFDFVEGVRLWTDVSLPRGVTYDEELRFGLSFGTPDDQYNSHWGGTIPAGKSSTRFGVVLPEGTELERLSVYFSDLPQDGPALAENVYYDGETTRMEYVRMDPPLAVEDGMEISMPLLTGVALSGTVSLPAGAELNDWLQGDVSAGVVTEDGESTVYHASFGMGAGETEAAYRLVLPEGCTVTGLEVDVYESPAELCLVQALFYNGETGQFEADYSDTELDWVMTRDRKLNVTLKTGVPVSGTLYLPMTFSSRIQGNVGLQLRLPDGSWTWMHGYFSFRPGQQAAEYSVVLDVPAGTEITQFRVSTWENDGNPIEGLAQESYYNADKQVLVSQYCECSIPLDGPVTMPELTIPTAASVSGTLYLPEELELTGSEGNVRVFCLDDDWNNYGNTWFTVTETTKNQPIPFSIPVPEGGRFYLAVDFDSADFSNALFDSYYYQNLNGTETTTADIDSATKVSSGAEGLTLRPALGTTITGTVAFAPGAEADGDLSVSITAYGLSSAVRYNVWMNVGSDLSGTYDWAIAVPKDPKETYRVSVRASVEDNTTTNVCCNTDFYYTPGGMTTVGGEAAQVSSGESGLRFTLPLAKTMSVTVEFADNVEIYSGCAMNLTLYRKTQGGYSSVKRQYLELQNTDPVKVSFQVAQSEDCFVSVRFSGNEGTSNLPTYKELFWNGSGFVSDSEQRVLIPAAELEQGVTLRMQGPQTINGTVRYTGNVQSLTDGEKSCVRLMLYDENREFVSEVKTSGATAMGNDVYAFSIPAYLTGKYYLGLSLDGVESYRTLTSFAWYQDDAGNPIPVELTGIDDLSGVSFTLDVGRVTVELPGFSWGQESADEAYGNAGLWIETQDSRSCEVYSVSHEFDGEGEMDVTHSCTIPLPWSEGAFRLRLCIDTQNTNVKNGSFYVTENLTLSPNASDAKWFTEADRDMLLDLKLTAPMKSSLGLSGTIHFPDTYVPSGEPLVFDIEVRNPDNWEDGYGGEITVQPDGTFFIRYPDEGLSGLYQVYISPIGNPHGILNTDTYCLDDTGEVRLINIDSSESITDLEFYPEDGKTISGNMLMPDDLEWTEGWVWLHLGWVDESELTSMYPDKHMMMQQRHTDFKDVEANGGKLPFDFTISHEAKSFALVVKLDLHGSNLLYDELYIGKDGTLVADPMEAVIFHAEDDLTNLTFTAASGNRMPVTIRKPDSVQDYLYGYLRLLNEYGEQLSSTYFNISSYDTSTEYTITVPKDGSFYLKYSCDTYYQNDLYTEGDVYINPNGTLAKSQSLAGMWTAEQLKGGVDFTLALNSQFRPLVTGRLNLGGANYISAVKKPELYLRFTDDLGNAATTNDVTLQDDMTYTALLPGSIVGNVTGIRLTVGTGGGTNLKAGDYTCTGFIAGGDSGDIGGADFTVDTVPVISGTLVAPDEAYPESMSAYTALFYRVYVNSVESSYNSSWSNSVRLDGDTRTGRFVVALPEGETQVKLRISGGSSIPTCGEMLYIGNTWYTADGTLSVHEENAAVLTADCGELTLTIPQALPSTVDITSSSSIDFGYETMDGLELATIDWYPNGPFGNTQTCLIPKELEGQNLLAYYKRYGSDTKYYVNPDGSATVERSKAISYLIGEKNELRITVAEDDTAPVAVIRGSGKLSVVAGQTLYLNGSDSHDENGISRYEWGFGDSKWGYGREVEHTYYTPGSYTVTLTVWDGSSNSSQTTVEVDVLATDSPELTTFTVKDTQSGAEIPYASITVFAGEETYAARANVNGWAGLILPDGKCTVQVEAAGYQTRSFQVERTETNRSFTVYMNADPLLRIDTTITEMSKQDIIDAGIDPEANKHVYECTAVFEFGPVVYYCGEGGEVIQTAPGNPVNVIVVEKGVYLVVRSRVAWLKEMFDVALVVENTSSVEYVEGVKAHLNALPDGLSLAIMQEGQQTLDTDIGRVSPGETSITHWYIAGDKEGSYTLSGSVDGWRTGGGISESIRNTFETKDPLLVQAGSAMELLIEADRYATVGKPYHVRYTLTNVSNKTLYDVSLDVLGGKFFNTFPYTHLDFTPGETLSGVWNAGQGALSVEEFQPGQALSGMFTIIFAEGIEADYTDYMLKNFFALTGSGSTTTIPTTIRYLHNWNDGEVVKLPTCTETGITRFTCLDEDCGETMEEIIPALGHSFTNYVYNNDATCTLDGTETAKCDRCGDTDTRTAENTALGHVEVVDAAKAPTCTETGLTEGKHCSRCGEILVKQETVPALGHDYAGVKTEPTCTEKGYTTYTCSRCGDSYVGDYVDALGHDEIVDAAKEPTCTETGLTEGKHCARCGEILVKQETVPALGHDYAGVKTEPTCTEKGYTTYTCSRCGDSYVADYVDALGHDYVGVKTEPTCTEKGYTTHTCSRCGDSYVADYVDALGHDWGEWVVTVHPTLDAKGQKEHVCRREGCGVKESVEMEKLTYQNIWIVELKEPANYDDADTSIMCTNMSKGGGKLSYRSDNEQVVQVVTSGALNGCKLHFTGVGTATITVTAAAVEDVYAETSKTFTVTVNKAKNPLVVKAKDVSITYGETFPSAPGFTVASGLKSGDSSAVLSGRAAYTTKYRQYDAVGSYAIDISGLRAKNYDVEFQSGTLTVKKASAYQLVFDANSLTWNVSGTDAVKVTAAPTIRDDTAVVKVEYMVGGQWVADAPADEGQYPVRAWLSSSENLVVPAQPNYIYDTLTIRNSSFINTGNKNIQLDVTEHEDGKVEVQVEDVQEIVDSVTDGTVTMDMTGNGVASGKTGLTIAGDLVEGLSRNETVDSFEVKTQDTEVTMDKNALATIADALKSDETSETKLTVQMQTVDQESLNEKQQQALSAIGGNGDTVVLDLQMQVTTFDQNGNQQSTENIHELGGVVEIRVAYDKPVTENTILVALYVNDRGETTYLPVVYENGFVHFVTDHFSVYAVKELNEEGFAKTTLTAKQSGTTLRTTLKVETQLLTGTYQLAVAAYDANGRMLGSQRQSVELAKGFNTFTADLRSCSGAASVKAMLLDDSLAPVISATEYSVQ